MQGDGTPRPAAPGISDNLRTIPRGPDDKRDLEAEA
jgi:hypothetical protein